MSNRRLTILALILVVLSLSLAFVPAGALAAADQPVAPPPGFNGAIDLQPGSISGRVMLDAGSAALQANVGDAGPAGMLQVAAPGLFVVSTNVGDGALDYNLALCGAGVTIVINGSRSGGVRTEFHNADADPGRCTAPPLPATPATNGVLMSGLVPFAVQAQPAASASDTQAWLTNWVRRLIGFSLLAGLLVLLIPGLPRTVAAAMQSPPWTRLGVGLALMLTLPLVGVLAFALLLPLGLWWLGLLLLAVYLVMLFVSVSVTGLAIGSFIVAWLGRWQKVPPLVGFAIGLILLTIATLLPYVGPVIYVAAVIFGLGTLALAPRTEASAPDAPMSGQPTTTSSAGVPLATPGPAVAA
jgi:hypothetical protein